MTVRAQSVTARLNGTTVPVEQVSYEHGVSLRAGDVVGSSATVQWADQPGVSRASQVAHPFSPSWARKNGTSVQVDLTDNGTVYRVFSGQVEATSGDLLDGSSSQLVDAINRLNTRVALPPVAFTMPPRADVVGSTFRRVGLWGSWYTHLAMMQAGYHACQAAEASSVYYQSFAGSAWPAPNPQHATDTLGHLTIVHRLSDPSTSPAVYQGTNTVCMQDVSSLGTTVGRRNSSSTAWQLTVDMASDAPTVFHTGKVDLRPLPVASGPGVRLTWTQTVLTVSRVNADGTTSFAGSVARAVDGVYTMRWSVVVRPDGSATLHGSGGRLNALQLTGTGIVMPSGTDRGTVDVKSEGPISAVQVTRSDATSILTRAVSARIHRATFSQRSLPGFDYVEPTPAISILSEQADAERGLAGLPIFMWIDNDGRLRNADAAYLWANPEREHVFANVPASILGQQATSLDNVGWSVPADGPYSRIDIRCRFGVVKLRADPTLLVAVGGQKNHEHQDFLDEFFHPDTGDDGDTWILPDLDPYYAGQPLPPPGSQEFNKGWGTWVGGTRVLSESGEPDGWIEPSMVDGWTVDASNHVRGALVQVDHRTILYKGRVNVGGFSRGMSSMPSSASAGLWEHRKSQPLPQIRGRCRIDWTTAPALALTSVTGSGGTNAPVLEHDGGMFVQNPAWREEMASNLAAESANPTPQLTLPVAVNPAVRVGDKATAVVRYPDGAKLSIAGLVVGVAATLPSGDDTMRVRMVALQTSWEAGDNTLGGAPATSGGAFLTDPAAPPPVLPPHDPPSTDPPIFGTL